VVQKTCLKNERMSQDSTVSNKALFDTDVGDVSDIKLIRTDATL